MTDLATPLAERVREAATNKEALYINGGGSKRDLCGRACDGSVLEVRGHRGIVDYEPAELVLTARAGTPLAEIETTLAAQGQYLGFEAPAFDGRATLGGTLASNINGPARPWRGSIRDAVLGVQIINGLGEPLRFGGQVMKNVAGYDVSRLQAGALGTLGVITSISLKVLPAPESELTLRYDMTLDHALQTMQDRAAQPKPLSGACWFDSTLYLRLSGADSAVRHTAQTWGGDIVDSPPWAGLRDLDLPFFAGSEPLWRLSIGATATQPDDMGDTLIDWCGAQRWLRGARNPDALHEFAAGHGGHCTLFRGGDRCSELRATPQPVSRAIQQRLKQAFDPAGILNPGRLYSWL